MKLSISNIAWDDEKNEKVLKCLKKNGFEGLEIAPTKICADPYHHIEAAQVFASSIKEKYSLNISSMQSIWFGRSENIFAGPEDRAHLLEYSKKAIDYASAIGCGNLVFGCPKNRALPLGEKAEISYSFFKELGDYATKKGTCFSMEANPVIYNTNFINYTQEAIELVDLVDSEGFKLNLDLGTVIFNNESIDYLKDNINKINHIHISEPGLELIQKRELHRELAIILREAKYDKFISIEMKCQDELENIVDTISYIKEVFG